MDGWICTKLHFGKVKFFGQFTLRPMSGAIGTYPAPPAPVWPHRPLFGLVGLYPAPVSHLMHEKKCTKHVYVCTHTQAYEQNDLSSGRWHIHFTVTLCMT